MPVPERPFVSADVGDLSPNNPRLGASTENGWWIVVQQCRNEAKMTAGLVLGAQIIGACVWLLYVGLAQLAALFPESFRASCSDRAQ